MLNVCHIFYKHFMDFKYYAILGKCNNNNIRFYDEITKYSSILPILLSDILELKGEFWGLCKRRWQLFIRFCGWIMLPALSVNKECCSHQAISHYSQDCTLRGFTMEKNRILTLDSQWACQGNDLNDPRLLHLPVHKCFMYLLNSSTWDIYFLLN